MMGAAAPKPQIRLPDVGEWPTAVKLSHEREALGFFITGHPIEAYAGIAEKVSSCSILGLVERPADTEVTVAGMVTASRAIRTKRGNRMAFVTLEDTTGSVECIFFADPYANSKRALSADQPLLIEGKLERGAEGTPKILAESARLLSEERERRTRAIHLLLEEDELADGKLEQLHGLIQASKGTCPVTVHLHIDQRAWVSLRLPEELLAVPDESLMQGLETLFQRADVARLQ